MRVARSASFLAACAPLGALFVTACGSIPGETLAPPGMHGEISERIYAHARSIDPQCRQQKIANTEVTEVHPSGHVAEERWLLENCGRRLFYVVSYPRRPTGGARFQVTPER